VEAFQTRTILGFEFDRRFLVLPLDGRRAPFEIETRGEFLARLIDGVVDLLFIDFGYDIE
jgi:hypothetical protein